MGGIREAIGTAATAIHQNHEITSHAQAVLRIAIPNPPDASAI